MVVFVLYCFDNSHFKQYRGLGATDKTPSPIRGVTGEEMKGSHLELGGIYLWEDEPPEYLQGNHNALVIHILISLCNGYLSRTCLKGRDPGANISLPVLVQHID